MSGATAVFQEIRKSTTGALDRAKLVFGREESNDGASEASSSQPDRLEELAEFCPQLSFQQRLIGFASSFSLGCTLGWIQQNPY